jgi:hypothetical protein
MAAETAALKPIKVTIRGDSADLGLGNGKPKESLTVALINGEWKGAKLSGIRGEVVHSLGRVRRSGGFPTALLHREASTLAIILSHSRLARSRCFAVQP